MILKKLISSSLKVRRCTAVLVAVSITAALSTLTVLAPGGETFAQSADTSLFDADGYRSHRYRAPLPDTVEGGTTIDADTLAQLIQTDDPVLIDVQAITLRLEAVEFGVSWLPSEQRYNIPDSTWLPNVGYAEHKPYLAQFFVDNLQRLTDKDTSRAIVFYCIADCWMSWNAVKRAASLGYNNLYWLPSGTQGWQAIGGELVAAEPEPIIDYLPTSD